MLQVRTFIAKSRLHGYGCFATDSIRRGQIIWEFTPFYDRKISPAELKKLPKEVRVMVERYAYRSKVSGLYILPVDNAKFMNHSLNPNCGPHRVDGQETQDIALRNIRAGEELTSNYRKFF
jgi:SET domain-containing protein